MRRTHDLIPDSQCPNWGTRLDVSLRRSSKINRVVTRKTELSALFLGLVVDQPCDLAQAFSVAGTGHDIADTAISPEHGAILAAVAVLGGVAHLCRFGRRL